MTLSSAVLLAVISQVCLLPPMALAMTSDRARQLREEVREAFFHGWNNYLVLAWPEDELQPLSCKGRGSDRLNPRNIGINDVCGDFQLTLIDSMDTLAIMGEHEAFAHAIKLLETSNLTDFSIVNSKVQVFETNIRILGGLLSAHLFASDPSLSAVPRYGNELLSMALALGERLLPAFSTPTGIPLPRVNIASGLVADETSETCAAGAGTLLLEFSTLSKLTGDNRFELAARKAFYAIWNRRSILGLVGNSIDANTGLWTQTTTSIGAGIDSFYEYALKAYVLLGEEGYYRVFHASYTAIQDLVRDDFGWTYRNIHLGNAALVSNVIDSLSAFWSGLQVLWGDVQGAAKSHLIYWAIWCKYGAIPERWNYATREVDIPHYPLRPEFIESTYFLYRATLDPFYLFVGEQILFDLQTLARTPCGWASLKDVRTYEQEDRMESFMLR